MHLQNTKLEFPYCADFNSNFAFVKYSNSRIMSWWCFDVLGPDTDLGILPRSLNMIFSSLDGRIFTQMCLKPQRCLDFIRLTKDQQNEEAVGKRNLLKLYKEVPYVQTWMIT